MQIKEEDIVIVDDIAYLKEDMSLFSGTLEILSVSTGYIFDTPSVLKVLNYKNGKKHGIEKIMPSENQYQEATYFEGKLHGYKKYYERPKGKLHEQREKVRDLVLREEIGFKNGVWHGVYIKYWRNGRIRIDGKYKNGEKDGVFKYYYENGKPNPFGTIHHYQVYLK